MAPLLHRAAIKRISQEAEANVAVIYSEVHPFFIRMQATESL